MSPARVRTLGAAPVTESSCNAGSARTSKRRGCALVALAFTRTSSRTHPGSIFSQRNSSASKLAAVLAGAESCQAAIRRSLGPRSAVQRDWASSQRTAPTADGNSTGGPPVGTVNSSRAVGTRGMARSKAEGRLPGGAIGRSVSSRRYSPGSAIFRSRALSSGSHSGCTGRSLSWADPGSRLTSSRRKGIRTCAAALKT